VTAVLAPSHPASLLVSARSGSAPLASVLDASPLAPGIGAPFSDSHVPVPPPVLGVRVAPPLSGRLFHVMLLARHLGYLSSNMPIRVFRLNRAYYMPAPIDSLLLALTSNILQPPLGTCLEATHLLLSCRSDFLLAERLPSDLCVQTKKSWSFIRYRGSFGNIFGALSFGKRL